MAVCIVGLLWIRDRRMHNGCRYSQIGAVIPMILRSSEAQREHPSDVPAHRHEIPFAFDMVEAAQQELVEPHHRFDFVR